MSRTIFFSWQADIPTKIGRNFLKEVLVGVTKEIASDTSIDEVLRDVEVDSDTQGVAGQPPIVDTIFKKIDSAAVFIADMSFVGTRTDGRPTPNPNVLIEYGWALKSLKYERVICVMNTAYGAPNNDNLPFDLKHLRWPICYDLPENCTPEVRAKQKKELIAVLNKAIRASLATIPTSVIELLLPAKFPATIPKDGPARFRGSGESLGFKEDDFLSSSKEVFLSAGPAIWLRMMPLVDPKKRWPSHELKDHAIKDGKMLLAPLSRGAGGYDFLRAEDGEGLFKTISTSENESNSNSLQIYSIAFAFETGEIWSTDTNSLKYMNEAIPFSESYFTEGIKNYSLFLQSLGIQPPYKWIAGIIGVKGRHLNYPVQPGYYRNGEGPVCAANLIEAEGVYDGNQSETSALLPFFEKIFNKCGMSRPAHLST